MKKEIENNEEKKMSCEVIRIGFDLYIPFEQIYSILNIPFNGIKSLPEDIQKIYTEVKMEDGNIKFMDCIHFKSITSFLTWYQGNNWIDNELIVKFLVALHKFHLYHEKELEAMLLEEYK
jgi:hypothetical protein